MQVLKSQRMFCLVQNKTVKNIQIAGTYQKLIRRFVIVKDYIFGWLQNHWLLKMY